MLMRIEPVDPIMTRDGRPFDDSPGSTASIMNEVSPGMLAGTIRTLLLKNRNGLSAIDKADLLRQLRIAGPLLEWNGHLYFPMPADLVIYEVNDILKVINLQPQSVAPDEGYFGVSVEGRQRMDLLPPLVQHYSKLYKGSPAFVREDWLYRELSGAVSADDWSRELNEWKKWRSSQSQEAAPPHSPFLQPYEREIRLHNAIDDTRGGTEEGKLFSTEALRFKPGVSLLVSIDMEGSKPDKRLKTLHSMGGKRRLARFQEIDWPQDRLFPWKCPESIASSMCKAKPGDRLRMTLATPAYFLKGWRPRWVDADFHTNEHLFECLNIPASSALRLKLQWACVDRWLPVSGWSIGRSVREGKEKAVRRMVPAGSVYFFELVDGDAGVLADNWLVSVSDTRRRKGPLDREDGFGLAIWGIESGRNCNG
ncbi:type III-B CRISPR module-associated protein Cmr3 [Cohnella faecalis]|uniref:Type III-B CRISPR module-associated protein Cmr3 n=1 Tax=Cohnella faecalis TaxID=2315694 RepID=A0A398D2R6_9BACL|nr:type III-B CRISPR module-associated protein Cmr3 [Cohnella faecalis]RIE05374.1 type III-B CRISPR module-associated protein Cmr3 [Cohnella faecalis]